MILLLLHLYGDYLTQSDWAAQTKTKSTWAAFVHATLYSLPFFVLAKRRQKNLLRVLLLVWLTHLLIDRFRLARYVVWAKNFISPRTTHYTEKVMSAGTVTVGGVPFGTTIPGHKVTLHREKLWWKPWSECSKTGYPTNTPDWLATWLMIVADNTIHLTLNELAFL